jgi:hypothetical protein
MLLVGDRAPLQTTLEDVVHRLREQNVPLELVRGWTPGSAALGTSRDDDALDSPMDPSIDRAALRATLIASNVPERAAPVLADALADREHVLDLASSPDAHNPWRVPTLFERGALVDVLGEDLASLLPMDRVQIHRGKLEQGLNHCAMEDGVARIRLLASNGRTLAGRTHALVHELGHALIGVARANGKSYAAKYGKSDYGLFLDRSTFDRPCDEEALVRAIADAWLLRRSAVEWSRTWPGAIDDAGKTLHADDLAAFARFRLAQGLGLPHAPIEVRTWYP